MATLGHTAITLCAAAIVAACSHPTGGASHPGAAQSTGSPRPASTAAPRPTPPSDEDQIRQSVLAFQDAANSQNWDAYLELMCAPMRARFTGTVMDFLKKERTQGGVTTVTITSVSIDGDNAKATFESHNESVGSATVSLPLKHEGDGWKICQSD